MNNDMKKNILKNFKLNVAISNFEKEELTNNNTLKNKEKIFSIKNKIIATVCASFILISGIVFATNITNIVNKRKSDRGLGDGIDTAVDNGYIEETKAEFSNNDNIGIDITLENFLMDDTNLSANLIFVFDDTMKEKINLDKAYEVELLGLIIRDEEDRILYGGNDEEMFRNYCEENSLNYIFAEFNENYINSGVGCFIDSKGDNSINLLYNMYSEGFPKSKKLYITLTKLSIAEWEGEKHIINGEWNLTVDVPEKMYIRSEENYKVVKCENKDFNVYTAKVSNTGFELGVIISNVKVPEVEDLQDIDSYEIKRAISSKFSYITNEQGEKFEVAFSPGRKVKGEFLEGNKFDFYETFSMTKYNATNRIKVILYYYGEPVTIELEKVN